MPIVYFSCGFALAAGDALFFFAAFLVCVTVSAGGGGGDGGPPFAALPLRRALCVS